MTLRFNIRLLFVCLGLVAGAASVAAPWDNAAPSSTVSDGRRAGVDALFKGFTTNTPGAAVGVYQNGRLVYANGYGMADLEAGTPITPHTRFHVASLSKEFTAFSIALLAREGKADLDTDIHRYLPFVPDFHQVITARQLILHTSGLRDQYALFDIGGQEIHNVLHEQQIINMVAQQRALNFTPGTEHVYCNTGYTLLGEVVRAVSGKTLREFTQQRIFGPLGMTSTLFYDDVTEIVPGRAQSYSRAGNDQPWKRDLLNLDNVGATSLLTTVEDLTKWAGNFTRPTVGDRALIEQVSHNGALDTGVPIRYGFGLQRTVLGGREIVTHAGSDAGFRAIFVYYPGHDFAVAITANTPSDPAAADSSLDLTGKVAAIADIYLPKSTSASIPATVDSRANPGQLVGTYLAPYLHSLQLEARDGKLYRHGEPAPQKLLQRVDGSFDGGSPEDEFFIPVKNSAGQVVAVEQHAPGDGRVTRFERTVITAPTVSDLEGFVGDYHSDELDITYRVALENGHLLAHTLWSVAPVVLVPVVPGRFESSDRYLNTIVFDRDDRGRIRGLRVSSDRARNIEMRRLPAGAGQ